MNAQFDISSTDLHLCRAAFADAKLCKVSQPGRHLPYSAQQLHESGALAGVTVPF